MNYTASIQRITDAQANYDKQCDLDDDDAIGAALDALHHARADHRAAFGEVKRINGTWI
jgi:hypothetical protein